VCVGGLELGLGVRVGVWERLRWRRDVCACVMCVCNVSVCYVCVLMCFNIIVF
jgi:hypothetical protein